MKASLDLYIVALIADHLL
jgi:hypothetical protein